MLDRFSERQPAPHSLAERSVAHAEFRRQRADRHGATDVLDLLRQSRAWSRADATPWRRRRPILRPADTQTAVVRCGTHARSRAPFDNSRRHAAYSNRWRAFL